MVLSKRERLIALLTLAALGVLGLDRLVVSPLMAANDDLNLSIIDYGLKLKQARKTIDERHQRMSQWADMQNRGLHRRDASDAESQMLNNIRDWAQEAGMTLISCSPERREIVTIKPEHAQKEKKVFSKSIFRVTGAGNMAQVGRFLWHVQSSEMPAALVDLQLTARKEATDDLSLVVRISTICLLPEGEREQPSETGQSGLSEVQP